MEAAAVIKRIDEFLVILSDPVSEELLADGWSEQSAADIRTRLSEFRDEVMRLGALPERSRRPLNMTRFLDACGVHRGEVLNQLTDFENELRRA